MPRVSVIQTNFTAGEISPRLMGRVDVSKYSNGAKTMENFYPLVHGGAKRRPGTRYAAAAKNNDKLCRLIPFIFSRTQAFVLEFGEGYIRFFNNSGQILSGTVPYEISSPYQEEDLADIHFVQSADTMFLAHPDYALRKLVRLSNTNWKLTTMTFVVPPSEEIGDRPATALTLGAVTGTGISATASAAAFLDSDVGRYIESGAGRALITAYTSTTVVTVTIIDDFASVNAASGAWTITESSKTTCTASAVGPVGVAITLTCGGNAWKETAQVNHEGKFVEINGGLVEITEISSDTVTAGIVRTVLSSTTAAPSGAWAIRENVWNATDGYPRAVSLFEQRLVAAGSDAFPQTIWGSRIAEYDNFADGAADDDGFSFTIAADQVNSIEHLPQLNELIPLTYGGEFSMSGGDNALTPTNVRAKVQTARGCNNCRPARVGDEVIFVQRGGRKIRAIGDPDGLGKYRAPDITVLAEHITDGGVDGGIYEMGFSQEPDQVVWMTRGDGVLVAMAIDRDQDAIGFGRQVTDGDFESIAVIPNVTTDQDQVWVATARTIGGSTKRMIEYFDPDRQTDCAIVGDTGGAATTAWSGLGHLEGETVTVVQDGFYGGTYTVASGAITLDVAAVEVEIGLAYTSTLVPVPPEVPTGQGTGQGNAMSVHELVIRFQDTIGGKVNGNTIETRQFSAGAVLDVPLTPRSYDKPVACSGWKKGGEELATIVQDLPFSMTVLACIYRMTAND